MNTDEHRWHRFGIVTVLKVIATIVVLGFMVSCERSTNYRSFLQHDQSYYTQVAEACGDLIVRLPPGDTNKANNWYIQANDPMLPPILRELHATRIRVLSSFMDGTNYYAGGGSISFGVSKSGWAIVWERNDYGNGNTPWELYVNSEGGPKIVYSTKEPLLQPNRPPGVTN